MVLGKLTALRLGLCCGSNAAHPKSVYAHTRYRTYTQNAALPFALCYQRFQPVLGCGRCRDAFPFPSLAVGHEEVGVIFGGENCVCPARSRPPQFLLPIALISLAGAVQSPQCHGDEGASQSSCSAVRAWPKLPAAPGLGMRSDSSVGKALWLLRCSPRSELVQVLAEAVQLLECSLAGRLLSSLL